MVCRLHLDPFDFIARLAALVPKPRVNLTRLCRDLHRLASAGCLRPTANTAHPRFDDSNVCFEMAKVPIAFASLRPQCVGYLPLAPDRVASRSGTPATVPPNVRNAHEADRRWVLGERQFMSETAR